MPVRVGSAAAVASLHSVKHVVRKCDFGTAAVTADYVRIAYHSLSERFDSVAGMPMSGYLEAVQDFCTGSWNIWDHTEMDCDQGEVVGNYRHDVAAGLLEGRFWRHMDMEQVAPTLVEILLGRISCCDSHEAVRWEEVGPDEPVTEASVHWWERWV